MSRRLSDLAALARAPVAQIEGLRFRAGIRWRFKGDYHLDDRQSQSDTLVMLLAGHKDFLWPHTLARVARFLDPGLDVCVVTPGRVNPALRDFAADHGWSHLHTEDNNVSLAQNLAIRAHPKARNIFKLDEDIFITEGHFQRLLDGYRAVDEDGVYAPGLCAPTINVNGYSYVDFVRALGVEDDEYRERFGELRRAADGVLAHHSGEAAVWLWQRTIPLDDTGARFAAQPFSYSAVPHRYSTGAILFDRSLWEDMDGFRRPVKGVGLGTDEAHICETCQILSRVMVVVGNVFAAHFSFGPQTDAMREAFEADLPRF